MFTAWEWVILMVTFGLVSTFEIIMIGSVIGRIIESKMKVKTEVEIKYYDKVIQHFDKVMEQIFIRIDKYIDNDTKKTSNIYDFRKRELDN